MGKIYFVRHGQSEMNVEARVCGVTNSPLTARGCEQAQETARMIKARIDAGEMRIDEILASPLERAYNTAMAISEATGIPVRVEPRLIEQNYGKWEGECKDTPEFFHAKATFANHNGGGESNMRVAQRIYNLLDDLRQDTDRTYLLAAHNGIGRIVYSYFHDMENEEFAAFTLNNAEVMENEF